MAQLADIELGSGLRALEQRVLRAGGIFLCGATLSGWTVKAIIP